MVTKRDLNILMGFGGLLAIVVVFWFVYRPYTQKAETLTAENTQLEERVVQLQDMMDKKDYYTSETDRMNSEMNEIYAKFPSNYRTEDAISYSIQEELIAPLQINGLQMDEPVSVHQVGVADATDTADADTQDAVAESVVISGNQVIQLNNMPVTLSFTASYDAYKRCLSYILENENRITIDKTSVAYDSETGLLTGTVATNMYYLTGAGRPYTAPAFAGVSTGTENPFGTVSLPSDQAGSVSGNQAANSEESEE